VTARPHHFGFLATEAVLFHPRLSHPAKLALAASLTYPNRNPSLSQLEAATGLRRKTIIDAQNELEREEIARYDRPRHPWEREPGSHRFRRSNRLTWVAREADPYHAANAKKKIELPGVIAALLPRGKNNAARFPLVALVYALEQLRRGAVQMEDEVAASLLRLEKRQVQRIRQEMRRLGLLVFVRREAPADIFTFPGATVHDPGRILDATRTRRFVPLHTACHPKATLLLASPAELAHANRTAARLGPHLTAVALAALLCRNFDAVYRDGDEAAPEPPPLTAADLFDALAAVEQDPPTVCDFDTCQEAHEVAAFDRWGTLSPTVGEPGLLPPTSSKNLRASAREEKEKTATKEDHGGAAHAWPLSDAALEESFGRKTPPRNIATDYDHARRRIAEQHGGRLTAQQLEPLDAFFAAAIHQARKHAVDDKRALYALIRGALGRTIPDELHDRMKVLRGGWPAWPALDTVDAGARIDVSAEIDTMAARL
jgi:hypothetical protein